MVADLVSPKYFGVCGSFPLGLLVYRSRFLPRFLGVWLAIAGFAWVILSLTGVLLPQYQGKVYTYSQPAFFGEIALMSVARHQGRQAIGGFSVLMGRRSARPHHRHSNFGTLFHSRPQCVQSRDSDFNLFDTFPEGVFPCLTKRSQAF